MKVGMVGCGKLGLMVALTIESCGHEVKGYDISPDPARYLAERKIPFQEEHAAKLLTATNMEMVPLADLCAWADILFLAIQTPHAPEFEGVTPLPEKRADFDYSYVKEAIQQIPIRPNLCVVISTVLPGTMEREILPLLPRDIRIAYSPQFIAMGTVYQDFMNPEFWLIGCEDEQASQDLKDFYASISCAPILKTDIRTAEGIKVFYNTFITAKTVLANLYGEMSERLGMNVDDIYRALQLSTRRLLSDRYLQAGMGDGGGCHPRDNIALSWLARENGLLFDFFEALMVAREAHVFWLADLIKEHRDYRFVVILGRAFKPETNIETGSPSLLLSDILTRRGIKHSCVEDYDVTRLMPYGARHLYFIGTKHARYQSYKFPAGSIVIDPFRYIPDQPGVQVIRIGEGKSRVLKSEGVTA